MNGVAAAHTVGLVRSHVTATMVASPVLRWASEGPRAGVVLTVTRHATYLDFTRHVIAVTDSSVPRMPNGVTMDADSVGRGGLAGWTEPARTAVLHAKGIDVEGIRVAWCSPASFWEPRIALGSWPPEAVRFRGRAILRCLGIDSDDPCSSFGRPTAVEDAVFAEGREGASCVDLLLGALAGRDPVAIRAAAERMLGRGRGLTPGGDDLLAAVAATVVAFGPSVALDLQAQREIIEALVPSLETLRSRTTSLSATLLDLAAEGRVLEPVARLLDLDDGGSWVSAVEALRRIGHTTGSVYAWGVGAAAIALTRPLFAQNSPSMGG